MCIFATVQEASYANSYRKRAVVWAFSCEGLQEKQVILSLSEEFQSFTKKLNSYCSICVMVIAGET